MICNKHKIMTLCSNITVRCMAMVEFDPKSMDRDLVPWEHNMARSIGMTVTDAKYIAFKEDCECNAKLNYFVFGVLDRCMVMVNTILTDESSIKAAMVANGNSKAGNISTGVWHQAYTMLVEGLAALNAMVNKAKVILTIPNF